MGGLARTTGLLRHRWAIVLAVAALAVQLIVPRGFMISAGDHASGPTMVICTGHAPVAAPADQREPAKSPKPSADSPCAFAGHGVVAPPPVFASAPIVTIAFAPDVTIPALDLAPGRGLAAPPPPST
ncbi:MAG: hypothetical protein JSR86_16255, partial [Proteobacteria bacterium]|nr:hypothetical protein [Pseudomonadota bacterium]